MNPDFIASLVFIGVAIPTFLALNRILDGGWRRRRLVVEDQSGRLAERPVDPWVDALGSLGTRPTGSGTRKLESLLKAAGYSSPDAARRYRATRAAAVLSVLGLTGLLGLVLPPAQLPGLLGLGLMLAVLAYSVAYPVLSSRAQARARAFSRGLPAALDLMSLSLQAGLDPMNATSRVAGAMRRAHPIVSTEFRRVHRVAEMRTMEDAWKSLAERVPTDEVRTFCSIMIQSERVGSGAAQALVEFSDNFRSSLRQRAEAQANRASFWMLFPTITCFLMAAGIIMIGPVLVQFTGGGLNDRTIFREGTAESIRNQTEFTPARQPSIPLETNPATQPR
jgi:pilus assembly protein TadC